jgi:hypothetical protein
MIHVNKFSRPVVTIADGSVTVYSEKMTGILREIRYEKSTFADGVDFTITRESTGESLWTEANVNASTVRRPHLPVHDGTGVALTYDGTYALGAPVALTDERVKIVIANGGATKSSTFHFTMETR